MAWADIFLPAFFADVVDVVIKSQLFIIFYTYYFSSIAFIYFKPSYIDTYTIICSNQQLTFVSIAFQKIVLKPFKQGIGCLLKGYDKIIHVISNHHCVKSVQIRSLF